MQRRTLAASAIRVRARRQEQGDDGQVPPGRRLVEWSPAGAVARAGVRTRLEQPGRNRRVPIRDCVMQGCVSPLVPRIDIPAGRQAHGHRPHVAAPGKVTGIPVDAAVGVGRLAPVVARQRIRPELQQSSRHGGVGTCKVQRSVPLGVPGVYVRSGGDECGDHGRVFVMPGGLVQGGGPVLIPCVHLRTGGDERCDHTGIVIPPRCPVQGGPPVPGPRVHLRSGGHKRSDDGRIVVVRGRPVQGRGTVESPCLRLRSRSQQPGGGRRVHSAPEHPVQRSCSLPVARVHVRARRQQQLDDGHRAVGPALHMQGGRTLVITSVHIRARRQQPRRPSGGLPRAAHRVMQGSAAPVVTRFHVRSCLQQRDRHRVAPDDGPMQGRSPPFVPGLQIGTGGQQQGHHGGILVPHRLVKRCLPVFVPRQRIGAEFDQPPGRVEVGTEGSSVQRRLAATVPCVHVGARLHEHANRGGVAAEVQRCIPVVVARIHIGTTGQQFGKDGGPRVLVQRGHAHPAARIDVGPGRDERRDDCRVGVPLDRQVQRSPTTVVRCVGVGARLQQQDGNGVILVPQRAMQRRAAVVVARRGIGTELQQLHDDTGVSVQQRGVQGSVAGCVPGTEVGSGRNQRRGHGRIPGRVVQRGPAGGVACVHVPASLDQNGNHGGVVGPVGRHMQGRLPAVEPGGRIRAGFQAAPDLRGGGGREEVRCTPVPAVDLGGRGSRAQEGGSG